MEHKIIFAGPVGAGKTTAIATVSDIPVVSTERRASDALRELKPRTTVAMDYGLLVLGNGQRIHLYGAPGQDRFDFMWDILGQGALGMVLLLDYSRDSLHQDLQHFIAAFDGLIRQINSALVIGVTRMELAAEADLSRLHRQLAELGLNVPLFEVDARRHEDVRQMLLALLSLLHPAVQREPGMHLPRPLGC